MTRIRIELNDPSVNVTIVAEGDPGDDAEAVATAAHKALAVLREKEHV